jgi:hypothetical protein
VLPKAYLAKILLHDILSVTADVLVSENKI